MTQEANGSYLVPKHLKQAILSYSQFIENGQAKLGQHYIHFLDDGASVMSCMMESHQM